MAQPYDRLAAYLQPGDYVKFTSKYGKPNWLHIEADEPLGQHVVPFANAGVFVPARAARAGAGTVVPAGGAIDAALNDMTFLEPQREDRMYQVLPVIFAIDRTTQQLVPQAGIPPLLELEWDFPSGDRQGEVDQPENVTINGVINNDVGRGRIPANMIYTRSDPSPVFQMFIFYKTYPAFRVINRTRGICGGGGLTQLDYDWYLSVVGKKTVFRTATEAEQRKLNNREIRYRSIPSSPGGVPPTLLRRD